MAETKQLEEQLDEIFVKNAPFQLPKNVKEWIVAYLPYINVFFGILSLWAAWGVYQAATVTSVFVDYANELSRTLGTGNQISTSRLSAAVWFAVIALVVQGVIWLAAFPGTKARQKSGWNLLFLAVVLNAAYGILSLFTYYGGIGSLLSYLLGTVIGLYFLFQSRSYYTGEVADSASKAPKATPAKAPKASKK